MIPPQYRLLLSTHRVRQLVYATFPWESRIAAVLYQVRVASDPDAFGRLVYGMFLLWRVEGMPATPDLPRTTGEIDHLPIGYGRAFGISARNVARKLLTEDHDVEDVLSAVAIKVMSDPAVRKALTGKPLNEAKSYVFRMISNQARDLLRAQQVRRHEELVNTIEDPSAWSGLADLIPEGEQIDILYELERAVSPRLLPDLPLYFELLLDGFSNAEIARKRMLPSLQDRPMSQQALAKYRDRLKAVLEKHFDMRTSLGQVGRPPSECYEPEKLLP